MKSLYVTFDDFQCPGPEEDEAENILLRFKNQGLLNNFEDEDEEPDSKEAQVKENINDEIVSMFVAEPIK